MYKPCYNGDIVQKTFIGSAQKSVYILSDIKEEALMAKKCAVLKNENLQADILLDWDYRRSRYDWKYPMNVRNVFHSR